MATITSEIKLTAKDDASKSLEVVGKSAKTLSGRFGLAVKSATELSLAVIAAGEKSSTLESAFDSLSKKTIDGGKAFQTFGISLLDSQGALKTTDVLFRDVADKISKAKTEAERYAIATGTMGAAGAKLLPALRDGASGLAKLGQVPFVAPISRMTQATDILKRTLGSLKQAGDRVASGLTTALNGASVGFVALGAAGATALIILRKLVNQAADTGDKFYTASQRLGVVPESLSQLEYAAKQSGASFEDLQGGLDKLGKNAATNEKSFKKWGLTARDTSGQIKPTSQLLFELSDRLQKASGSSERMAIAQELMGRGAGKLIPALRGGSNELRAMMKEADELGYTVSTTSAILGDQFNDEVEKVSGGLSNMGRMIGDEVLPYATQLAKEATAIIKQMVAWTRENKAWIATGIETVLSNIATVVVPGLLAGFSILVVSAGKVRVAWAQLQVMAIGLQQGALKMQLAFLESQNAQEFAEGASTEYIQASLAVEDSLKRRIDSLETQGVLAAGNLELEQDAVNELNARYNAVAETISGAVGGAVNNAIQGANKLRAVAGETKLGDTSGGGGGDDPAEAERRKREALREMREKDQQREALYKQQEKNAIDEIFSHEIYTLNQIAAARQKLGVLAIDDQARLVAETKLNADERVAIERNAIRAIGVEHAKSVDEILESYRRLEESKGAITVQAQDQVARQLSEKYSRIMDERSAANQRLLDQLGQTAGTAVSNVFSALIEGNESAGKIIVKTVAASVAAMLPALAARAFAESYNSQAGIPIIGPILGTIAATAASGLILALASKFHSGGEVTKSGPRRIPGLGPREVPIIAEEGEIVFSRDDVARGRSQGGASQPAQGEPRSVTINVNTPVDRAEYRRFLRDVVGPENARLRRLGHVV